MIHRLVGFGCDGLRYQPIASVQTALTLSQAKMSGQTQRMAAELSLRRLQAIRAHKRHQAWMTVAKGTRVLCRVSTKRHQCPLHRRKLSQLSSDFERS